uniref:Uncharacterized protein n=1 Tax=Alexandrium andersonii TaxID=327968 RepID=A0A7S2J6G8_9DINO
MRQHLLGEPLPSAAQPPARLPRLVAPAAFPHAAVQFAEVLKTQTVQNSPAVGAAAVGEKVQHTAELSGCFFPSQVRRFSELLTVLLPNCSCNLTAEARLCAGINAFTQLGMRHVETVEFESLEVPNGGPSLKWDFKLAA